MFCTALLLLASTGAVAPHADSSLISHWPFHGHTHDASGHGRHGQAFAVDLEAHGPDGVPRTAARFDGRTSYVEVASAGSLALGSADFTLAAWVHTEAESDDLVGDLVSKFDPANRRGLNWCIKSGPGMTTSQANDRNIHLGTDSGTDPRWTDCGRPGNAVYIMAMAVHDGRLFVGTCEPETGQSGHVYRYDGGTRWIDCGSPDRANAITSLARHDGRLYAGSGRYRLAGSSLPESTNDSGGGLIARYDGDGRWTDCGRLPGVNAIGGMVVFQCALHASSLYRPAGLFRYQGDRTWQRCALPDDGRRVDALSVFNGSLYAGSYDSCAVARFDGQRWQVFPDLEPSGQTYSFEAHAGELHVGTWPSGQVFRLDRDQHWIPAGRLGQEKEVMGMAVYNGMLYAGTLPLAEVYRLDGDTRWTSSGRIDLTPEVRYRRAWSMAVHDGRLFCGTLPSGRVHALEAGQNVTFDRALKPGWRHLAAVRQGTRLALFVDGSCVATSSPDAAARPLDLDSQAPLRIGLGRHDHFQGAMSDLHLYSRALPAHEIAALATRTSTHPVR